MRPPVRLPKLPDRNLVVKVLDLVPVRWTYTPRGSVARAEGCAVGRPRPILAGVAGMAVLGCAQTSMSRRQWSLTPHSSTPFMALTVMLSWKPREAKT